MCKLWLLGLKWHHFLCLAHAPADSHEAGRSSTFWGTGVITLFYLYHRWRSSIKEATDQEQAGEACPLSVAVSEGITHQEVLNGTGCDAEAGGGAG